MVNPVPQGWQPVIPYLVLEDADRTIAFYKQAFAAEEQEVIRGPDGKVAHCELRIGGCVVMCGDANPEKGAKPPREVGGSPITLYHYVTDVDAVAERAAAAGGTVVSPPTTQFYGDRVATIEDPCGHTWCVATHVKDMTPDEIAKAAEAHQD